MQDEPSELAMSISRSLVAGETVVVDRDTRRQLTEYEANVLEATARKRGYWFTSNESDDTVTLTKESPMPDFRKHTHAPMPEPTGISDAMFSDGREAERMEPFREAYAGAWPNPYVDERIDAPDFLVADGAAPGARTFDAREPIEHAPAPASSALADALEAALHAQAKASQTFAYMLAFAGAFLGFGVGLLFALALMHLGLIQG